MNFRINDQHWLDKVKRVPSPFCDSRQDETDISLLVIHNISLPPGQFGGSYIEQLFTGQLDPDGHPYFREIHQLRVSAHCLIRRDGEVIQFVPFNARAWHAGVSEFAGRDKCNDYSVGIELEGTDTLPYTPAQYDTLRQLTRTLFARYPQLTRSRITGHEFIAPGRKTDPGLAFDWRHYKTGLSD
ncbi:MULTISPECIES: 1,6-anhydro-N-acetylmuramyl-L-alanine amidase AmpD [Photobacterium]|uniref:1,6-anhydro-N-acetylmuramyl-L-alanine amidase AmpD n=1 Tax=Photobacterium halotolerans TaxID=265726 RepID=A0A0F5VDL5_9GAMM|nr:MULTISPECIES: 1,6-anhydro-N-acetylmuramyl-L-alanine amidase AmpD [Photobacterium]KKC99901.1 N-acetyl-anhydromuranmyl-L-alanine amidase [Photobacterium halotolerans]UIP28338.1 1,6-anhydro-N-acetylmuramyl-L-alanine amidase AmpD [Photobacterium sp. TLY01]